MCVCVPSCVWLCIYVSRPVCLPTWLCVVISVSAPIVLVCVLADGVWVLVGVTTVAAHSSPKKLLDGLAGVTGRSPLPLAAEDKGQREVLCRF